MTRGLYGLIMLSVVSAACAQIFLKAGMAMPAIQQSLATEQRLKVVIEIASNPLVAIGLLLYSFGAIVWLLVLARVEVSFAYPFVALGFIFTAVLGRLVFHDSFSAAKVVGTLLITAGVLVLARG